MKVGDLFCGCGGFSEGFKQAGFEIAWAVDNNEVALASHEANHPEAEHWAYDIRKVRGKDLGHVDVLIGSPPCQGFSVQKYARPENRAESADMIKQFHRIRKAVRPTFWIWECTPRAQAFAGAWPSAILDAHDYGVPQRRKRVFVGNYPIPRPNPHLAKPCPTIVAWELSGGFKNARGRRFSQWLGRKPSVDEMMSYMGFPGGYIIVGNQHQQSLQIGNAVCPPVARALALAIAPKEMPRPGWIAGKSADFREGGVSEGTQQSNQLTQVTSEAHP
jgi:site-specific DNA-cytosine methylase